MRILVLGGTIFLGRHFVIAARDRGHEVVLFHRGEHNPGLFPELETVKGDRRTDLARLGDRKWDAVVDTCGYVPRVVAASAAFFAQRTAHYTFVSSISVLADLSRPWIDESAPVARLESETEEVNGETYGPLKALCEAATLAALPACSLVVRPGLIVGPHDPTHRFTYWPSRFARGGDVLVPDTPEEPIQVIDARDLAAWMVLAIERGLTGTYHATGPETPFTWRDLVTTCQEVAAESTGSAPSRIVWVSEAFLQEREVGAWMELPLWIPTSPETVAFSRVSIEKAKQDGLVFRPLAATVRDTLAWYGEQPERSWPAGLAPEKEAELLRAWKSRADSAAS